MLKNIIKIFKKNRVKNLGYKYVHIMPNDKFSLPFITFMNNNFNNKNQCFIYFMPRKMNFRIPTEYKNVFLINNFEDLKLNNKRIEKIFAHCMNVKSTLKFMYQNKELLHKCYWIIWGSDIYTEMPETEEANYVKKNVKAVITNFDKELYHKKYNKDKKVLALPFYPSVINNAILDSAFKIDKDYISIQINNSADISTIEMLDILSKFKNENIKIYTILSYGMTKFNNEIISKGTNILGNKFIAITEYLTPEQYAQHLKNIDILILNQNRQQGVGNIRCSLYLGNKVFIRNEVSTFNGFLEKGYKIFDTNKIKDIDFKEFILISNEEKVNNRKLVESYFDNTDIKKSWEIFYND